jgi:hypothetical protein
MIPDEASPELIECVPTCFSSGNVDTYTLFMCLGGCYAATYLGESTEEKGDIDGEDEHDSENGD